MILNGLSIGVGGEGRLKYGEKLNDVSFVVVGEYLHIGFTAG